MKNRILSLLLVLVLLVTVSIVAVEATTTEAPISYEEAVATAGGEADVLRFYCEACESNQDFTKASIASNKFTPATGHGYVPASSSLSDTSTVLKASNFANVNGKLCLYLKGDVLYTGTTRMFQLYSKNADKTDCALNIMGVGTIKSTAQLNSSSSTTSLIVATTNETGGTNTFTMYGGTIDCTESTNAGPTVFYANGTTATAKNRIDKFVMKGGTIKGGSSTAVGGTIYLKYTCDFEMTGGTIIGGTTTGQAGGMIYMSEYSSGLAHTFTMSGGTIKDGKIECTTSGKNVMGGNLYIEDCDVSISGDAKILNGKAETSVASARGGNMYITGTANLSISGDVEISGGHAVTTKNSTDVYAQGGNMVIQENIATTISGGTIKDGHVTVKNNSDCFGGNLCTFGDVTMSGGTIQDGYTYRTSNNSYTSAKNRGGNLYVYKGTFTMTGGTIQKTSAFTLSSSQCNRGGNVYVGTNFVLNGADAVIKDGSATRGANVAVESDATMTVSNGTISGGNSSYGRGIFIEGEVTLAGGSVENNRAHGIYILNRKATTIETGEETIEQGKLTITDGFTGTVYLRANNDTSSSDTVTYEDAEAFVADGKVSSNLAVADGYVDGGKVIAYGGGTYHPVVGSGTELVAVNAIITNGDGDYVAIPATLEAAVSADLADGEFVKLLTSGEELTLTKATTIDFNGQAATVNGAEYLTAMDAATNDYDATDAAKVTLNGAVNVNNIVDLVIKGVSGQRKYVALQNTDGTYSFHRYYITMRNVGLRVTEDKNTPDLIFSATFRGTEAVAAAVTSFGIDMKGEGAESAVTVDYMTNGVAFEAGKTIYGKNINLLYRDDDTVTNYGAKNVTATAFIQLGDIRLEASEATETSLKAQVEHFAADYANQSETGKAIIDTMLTNNVDLFNTLGWAVTKQEAAA